MLIPGIGPIWSPSFGGPASHEKIPDVRSTRGEHGTGQDRSRRARLEMMYDLHICCCMQSEGDVKSQHPRDRDDATAFALMHIGNLAVWHAHKSPWREPKGSFSSLMARGACKGRRGGNSIRDKSPGCEIGNRNVLAQWIECLAVYSSSPLLL